MTDRKRYWVNLLVETDLNPADWEWQKLVDLSRQPGDVVLKVEVNEQLG